jgi:uncharacterized protein (DUF1501 family)
MYLCCESFLRGRTTRRTFLRVGALGGIGLTLPRLLCAEARAAAASPRAKSCILLFQFGGASHLDTFDPKPDAPAEIRGEFATIATRVPGVRVTEHLPQMARIADKYMLVRSVHHRSSNHNPAAYYSLTGHEPAMNNVTANASGTDWPAYGSVIDRFSPAAGSVPTAVSLPTMIADGPFRTPGEFGGLLGKMHDPLFIARDPNAASFDAEELTLPAELSLDRVGDRRSLLSAVDARSRFADRHESALAGMDAYHQRAFGLLTSTATKQAIDIAREEPAVRDRYGRTTYGQSVLLARRLVEAGVRFVTVYYSPGIGGWDTHQKNFETLKGSRLPQTDQTVSALLEDLDARGLLDETLVMWTGDFGRTPQINNKAGRDHWPQCYTVLLAGGGVRGGGTYGASDRSGAYPKDKPVRPDDLSATLFEAMGLDPAREMIDPLNRPVRISYGAPIPAILSA